MDKIPLVTLFEIKLGSSENANDGTTYEIIEDFFLVATLGVVY